MGSICYGIKEAFQFAQTLSESADNDIERGEYIYAMHKYKAMANSFIEAFKKAPPKFKDEVWSDSSNGQRTIAQGCHGRMAQRSKDQRTRASRLGTGLPNGRKTRTQRCLRLGERWSEDPAQRLRRLHPHTRMGCGASHPAVE